MSNALHSERPGRATAFEVEPLESFEIPRPEPWQSFKDSVRARLLGPRLLRFGLGLLRSSWPVAKLGTTTVVTRHADVVDLLGRPVEFSVEASNGRKMDALGATFILGMDAGQLYDRERGWLDAAMRADDAARIRSNVRAWAEELLDARAGNGQIDVCGEYARVVGARLAQVHLGVPGPDTGTLMRWMRDLFHDLFLDLGDTESVHRSAVQSSRELAAYLEGWIKSRRQEIGADPNPPDDLLGRLIALAEAGGPIAHGLDADGIRRSISGVIVGCVDTTNKSFCFVLDQLLRNRKAFDLAVEAARADDAEALRDLVYEALRFNPHNPIIVRHCPDWTVIAPGTSRARSVPPGTRVFAATLSAMFDETVFDAPNEFLPQRTTGHLHFGDGLHRCFGERINDITLAELLGALLRRTDVRRAGLLRGRMQWDGPFPDRMEVRFR